MRGIRLNNFNVEYSCTVSRAALLTGRYAIRTGATQGNGITLWEFTIAEALKAVGYATALFGKWHLGGDSPEGRREPSHQGFDEYYGIPRTSHEAQTSLAPAVPPLMRLSNLLSDPKEESLRRSRFPHAETRQPATLR